MPSTNGSLISHRPSWTWRQTLQAHHDGVHPIGLVVPDAPINRLKPLRLIQRHRSVIVCTYFEKNIANSTS
jgi:hypothetical protein